MTSNRSFFDMRLLRETLRRNIWAIALSFVGFFVCLPLPAAMLFQNRLSGVGEGYTRADALENAAYDIQMLLGVGNVFVKFGICIMAVLCGIALFRYLHTRKQVDFYHSIPMKRGALFVNNFVTGIVAVLPAFLIMYALTAVIAMVMGVPADVPNSITGSEAVQALLTHILFFLFIYAVSVLAAVLTGNTIIAVLLDMWLLFSLPCVALMGQALASQYLDTWGGSTVLSWIGCNTSPVVLYFILGDNIFGYAGRYWRADLAAAVPVLAGVLAATAVLAVLGFVLFQRRKSERAGTAIAFQGLKLPLKCYMVLVISFLFGIVFMAIGGEFWVWFGLLAGTVLGHILIEMIYHFDFRAAFAHWKTMIVLAVAAVVLMVGIQNDVMGYDRWLPKESSIEAVGFMTGLSNRYTGYSTGLRDVIPYGDLENELLTSPETIAAIRNLAEIGIACTGEIDAGSQYWDDESRISYNYITVYYQLSGGRIASRQYSIPENDEVWSLMNTIRFSQEYISKYNPLFAGFEGMKEGSLQITARTNAEDSSSAGMAVADPVKAKEILDTLREETLTLDWETAKSVVPVLRLDIRYAYDREGERGEAVSEYVPVYPSYTRTLALLKEQGIEPQALTADALSDVKVYWDEQAQYYEDSPADAIIRPAATEMEDSQVYRGNGYAIIRDKAQMQALLENAVLEPVVNSCDVSMQLFSSADEQGNYGDYGTFTVIASFPNNFTCTLYYPEGKFPVELCQAYRSGTNP